MSPNQMMRRVLNSFWAPPIICLILCLLLFATLLWIDTLGASDWIMTFDYPLDLSAETLLETVSTATGVLIGLFTLFFSITLIVLTMASSNLGVRLIDRWISNRVIGSTLSILLALVVYGVLLQGVIDPSASNDEAPRLTTLALLFMMVLLFGWLAYAFHHLSRRIHVDTSIVDIGHDLRRDFSNIRDVVDVESAPSDVDCPYQFPAWEAGYLEDIDFETLTAFANKNDLKITLPVRRGTFLLKGDAMACLSRDDCDEDKLKKAFGIGGFRTGGQGARFQIMLLAEIAARALSPAINDLYTAMACIDHIVAACAPVLNKRFSASGWICDDEDTPRIKPNFDPILGVVDQPLSVIRHAAAPYSAVNEHLLVMMRRLYEKANLQTDQDWIKKYANAVYQGAQEHVNTDADRTSLEDAMNVFRKEAMDA